MVFVGIHYDTTVAKHTDPSDITVNLCLNRSEDVIGSKVIYTNNKQQT